MNVEKGKTNRAEQGVIIGQQAQVVNWKARDAVFIFKCSFVVRRESGV